MFTLDSTLNAKVYLSPCCMLTKKISEKKQTKYNKHLKLRIFLLAALSVLLKVASLQIPCNQYERTMDYLIYSAVCIYLLKT